MSADRALLLDESTSRPSPTAGFTRDIFVVGGFLCFRKKDFEMEDKLIRLAEVMSATSLARSTIYKYIKLGKFPEQKGGTLGIATWRLSDIKSWIASDTWPPADGGRDEA